MYLDLSKSYELHGTMEFQGLLIAVENDTGSARHWYDPHEDTHGTTVMKYPYGYVKGTLGVDGDEVDVFVGPFAGAENVYVITQTKAPEFAEIDEQKVMLGFLSATDAKQAYLDHYTDPKFFASMKEFPLAVFKEKLKTHRGKLIKHLFQSLGSANIQQMVTSKGYDMTDNASLEKSCEHSKSVTCEKCDGTHSAKDLLKALTARMLATVSSHKAKPPVTVALDPELTTQEVLFGPQVAQAMHHDRPWEPPQVPVVAVQTPIPAASPLAPDFLTSCDGCGYTHKSLSTCPRCAAVAATNREATPIWRR